MGLGFWPWDVAPGSGPQARDYAWACTGMLGLTPAIKTASTWFLIHRMHKHVFLSSLSDRLIVLLNICYNDIVMLIMIVMVSEI